MTWELVRTVQCAKCPWKTSTDPNTIPNGYSRKKHEALTNTIAVPGAINPSSELRIMSCHEEHASPCIGWLHHQLGEGNNIPLRLHARNCKNIHQMEIVGPQHSRFEDTLPQ